MVNERGTLAVVGLSYVGLPVAVLAKEKGWNAVGVDINAEKVASIRAGKPPFDDSQLAAALERYPIEASTDPSVTSEADVVVVAVQTPVDEHAHPDLGPLTKAVTSIAPHLKPGVVLSIESTINPGVCEEVLVPLLERLGRNPKSGDVLLLHCPERVNPGDRRWTVRNIPRVLGGFTPEALERGAAFYESILEAPVRRMTSLRAAEAVKITENTFRDINIAFVNELAQSFDRLGIDVQEVIAGAATKPFAFMAHYPGCGVGGHCIPVDPYYLIERARQEGFDHQFLRLARDVNKGMPEYAVARLIAALGKDSRFKDQGSSNDGALRGVKVALLGLSYKRDIDDLRGSPALEIRTILKREGADVTSFDPHVPRESTVENLQDALRHAEAVLIATDHTVFRNLCRSDFEGTSVRVIVDGKNCLSLSEFAGSGILVRGIGRSLDADRGSR